MARPVGSEVVVKPFQRKRGVILEAAGGGRYRVRVGNVTAWCREDDLASPEETKKGRTARTRPEETPPPRPHDATRAGRVDLHGLTVEEALARLVDEIDRAIRAGADRVEVVHGKGSGRIKHAVHRHLASIPSVAAFKVDEHNPGVTWVFL